MKKQNASLIAKMLNKNSQPEQKPAAEEILMLDARELVPNPKNKEYSLEDIEQLASMIQMTHNIEPATARKLEDGRFMLTSGHRRRLAQLYRFEQGWIDKPMMPVIHREIINDFEQAISNDEMETLNIVFPNKGQRRHLTPSEEAAEIAMIRPILYKIYQHEKQSGAVEGKFRTFFADVLDMSEATLHRKEAINHVSEEIKAEIDAGTIKPTAAAALASMEPDQQNAVVEKIRSHGEDVSTSTVQKARKATEKAAAAEPAPAITAPVEKEETVSLIAPDPIEVNSWVRKKVYDQLCETKAWLDMATEAKSEKELPLWQARVRRFRDILNFLDGKRGDSNE